MEIITTVMIRIGGTELGTKPMSQLKQASVSVEKVSCCCDEPAPLLALGSWEENTEGMELAQHAGGYTWLRLS